MVYVQLTRVSAIHLAASGAYELAGGSPPRPLASRSNR